MSKSFNDCRVVGGGGFFFSFFFFPRKAFTLICLKEEMQKQFVLFAVYCSSAFFFSWYKASLFTLQVVLKELGLQNSNRKTSPKKALKMPERQERKAGIYLVSIYYVCRYINIPGCSKTTTHVKPERQKQFS